MGLLGDRDCMPTVGGYKPIFLRSLQYMGFYSPSTLNDSVLTTVAAPLPSLPPYLIHWFLFHHGSFPYLLGWSEPVVYHGSLWLLFFAASRWPLLRGYLLIWPPFLIYFLMYLLFLFLVCTSVSMGFSLLYFQFGLFTISVVIYILYYWCLPPLCPNLYLRGFVVAWSLHHVRAATSLSVFVLRGIRPIIDIV